MSNNNNYAFKLDDLQIIRKKEINLDSNFDLLVLFSYLSNILCLIIIYVLYHCVVSKG